MHTMGASASREDSQQLPLLPGDLLGSAGLCHSKPSPFLIVNHQLRKSHGPKIPRTSTLFWEIPGISTPLLATTLK